MLNNKDSFALRVRASLTTRPGSNTVHGPFLALRRILAWIDRLRVDADVARHEHSITGPSMFFYKYCSGLAETPLPRLPAFERGNTDNARDLVVVDCLNRRAGEVEVS